MLNFTGALEVASTYRSVSEPASVPGNRQCYPGPSFGIGVAGDLPQLCRTVRRWTTKLTFHGRLWTEGGILRESTVVGSRVFWPVPPQGKAVSPGC